MGLQAVFVLMRVCLDLLCCGCSLNTNKDWSGIGFRGIKSPSMFPTFIQVRGYPASCQHPRYKPNPLPIESHAERDTSYHHRHIESTT
ncbi:hypothetical protein I7I53_02108 [Histoplasma capsulatum var. duboisii H88]|uniref:Secreted protein n=1 Tax=Ajellomyces capsulatus (strain H88) TaxID=544711 RepID=A0A8A1LKT5_AJEC8|nr:hypothetical protein I7I53_02108 [Histoplasma capsulatum var. duboisii H88]